MLILTLVNSDRSGEYRLVPVVTRGGKKMLDMVKVEVILRDKHLISIHERVVQMEHIKGVSAALAYQIARNDALRSIVSSISKTAFNMGGSVQLKQSIEAPKPEAGI